MLNRKNFKIVLCSKILYGEGLISCLKNFKLILNLMYLIISMSLLIIFFSSFSFFNALSTLSYNFLNVNPNGLEAKKNILKSNSFGVMQTVFFAYTCKFGLCLHVEKVIICINKTNWHPQPPYEKNKLLLNEYLGDFMHFETLFF